MAGINRQQADPFARYGGVASPEVQAVENRAALPAAVGAAYPAALRTVGQLSGPASIYNPFRLRAFQTAAQNYPANANTLVVFDSATRDPMGGFTAATNSYKVPAGAAGTWLLNVLVAFAAPAIANINQQYQAWIYVNGVVAATGPIVTLSQGAIGGNLQSGAVVLDELDLNAGDVTTIHLLCGAVGGVTTAITGTVNSYWTMRLDNVQGG